MIFILNKMSRLYANSF